MDARTKDLIDAFLREMNDDYVGLWQIVHVLREEWGVVSPADLRKQTMLIVRQLLSHPEVKAGLLSTAHGFLPWNSNLEESMLRISRDWDALGRDPTLSEVAYFDRGTEKQT